MHSYRRSDWGSLARGGERSWPDLECGYRAPWPLNRFPLTNVEAFTLVIESLGMWAESPTASPCRDFQDRAKPPGSLPDFPRRANFQQRWYWVVSNSVDHNNVCTDVFETYIWGKKIKIEFIFTNLYNIHSFTLIQGNKKKTNGLKSYYLPIPPGVIFESFILAEHTYRNVHKWEIYSLVGFYSRTHLCYWYQLLDQGKHHQPPRSPLGHF